MLLYVNETQWNFCIPYENKNALYAIIHINITSGGGERCTYLGQRAPYLAARYQQPDALVVVADVIT